MAGPATLHQRISSEYGVGDDLPCADAALLVPLKRSSAYGAIRRRVADLRPVDSWQEDQFHFFVFALRPAEDAPPAPEDPVAVFAMHPEAVEPVSAVVVTPGPEGEQAEVQDLRRPDSVYTAPLTPLAPPPVAATPPAPAPVPIAPPVTLALSAGEPGCDGALTFTATAAGGSGSGYTFAWTLDGRAVARVPATADATSTLSYTPWPDGRDHVVTVEVVDQNGAHEGPRTAIVKQCVATAPLTIT